jgi:hypothetical protein
LDCDFRIGLFLKNYAYVFEVAERIWYVNIIKAQQRTALPPVVLGIVISRLIMKE